MVFYVILYVFSESWYSWERIVTWAARQWTVGRFWGFIWYFCNKNLFMFSCWTLIVMLYCVCILLSKVAAVLYAVYRLLWIHFLAILWITVNFFGRKNVWCAQFWFTRARCNSFSIFYIRAKNWYGFKWFCFLYFCSS